MMSSLSINMGAHQTKMKREPLLAKIRFSKSAQKKIDPTMSSLSINMGAHQYIVMHADDTMLYNHAC